MMTLDTAMLSVTRVRVSVDGSMGIVMESSASLMWAVTLEAAQNLDLQMGQPDPFSIVVYLAYPLVQLDESLKSALKDLN